MVIEKISIDDEIKIREINTIKENNKKNYDLKKIKVGIPGIDEVLGGGIPHGNLVVVSGDPGSGKTVFCLEFLYFGAKDYGENGIYISLEETDDDLIKTAKQFGWDFEELIEQKKIDIITIDLYDFEKLKNAVDDSIARLGAKRIVIDPGVIFRLYFRDELDARKKILTLGRMLKKSGCTAIITNEATGNSSDLFGLEEYVADGVILLLHKRRESKFVRSVAVVKMRNSRISEKLHPIKFTSEGIQVLADQEIYE